MSKKLVGVDEHGRRVGQYHPLATLSDEEVELIRDLYEEGCVGLMSLAVTFGVNKATIWGIVTYRRRASTVMGWREEKAKKERRKANKEARRARKRSRR